MPTKKNRLQRLAKKFFLSGVPFVQSELNAAHLVRRKSRFFTMPVTMTPNKQ